VYTVHFHPIKIFDLIETAHCIMHTVEKKRINFQQGGTHANPLNAPLDDADCWSTDIKCMTDVFG